MKLVLIIIITHLLVGEKIKNEEAGGIGGIPLFGLFNSET